jgi:hypothetical protein
VRKPSRVRYRRWGFFKKPNPRLAGGAVACLGVVVFTMAMLALRRGDHTLYEIPASSPGQMPAYIQNAEQSVRGGGADPQQLRASLGPDDVQRVKSSASTEDLQKLKEQSAGNDHGSP